MAYSYYCKHCGANTQGGKAKVQAFKSVHRPRVEVPDPRAIGGKKFVKMPCPLARTKQGTLARPELARHINSLA